MDRRRIAGVLITLLAGCLDPAAERTARDFEETGRAAVGPVQVRIDQGLVVAVDAEAGRVRFRANAPEVRIDLVSSAAESRRVEIVVENVSPAIYASATARGFSSVGRNAVGFEVEVLGESSVSLMLPGIVAQAPFRFAWVGDVQGGYEKFERLRQRIDEDPTLEFVLFAGDITQRGLEEEFDGFLAAAGRLARPWYSLIGNHETIAGSAERFQRRVGRLNVSFDYRGARFVLIDSAAATLDPRVRQFLDEAIQGGPALKVVGMHVPPFDYAGLRDGGFASRTEAGQVMSRLADGGVDLLLAGHLHTLQLVAEAGVTVGVSGNGGTSTEARLDGTGMHYLAISVEPAADRVEVTPVHVP